MILKILLKRLHIIPIKAKDDINFKYKLTFLSELAALGYRVKNHKDYNNSIVQNYGTIINILEKMKGGDVDYIPLFLNFPNDIPTNDKYFLKRLIGYIGNISNLFTEENSNEIEIKTVFLGKKGTKIFIPQWLFDIEEFGADPITQFQSSKLFKKGVEKQKKRKKDTHTEWIDLELVDYEIAIEKLKIYLQNNLYSKSSIKESLKKDIEFLLDYFDTEFIDPEKVVFKETKAYLMKYHYSFGNLDALERYIDTPTDLLRLFAALTNSDISLSEKIKFPKFNRANRRFILESLEKSSNLLENLNDYRGLWLEIGRYLHPGEYRKKYPKTFKAFDILRNEKIVTFNGRVERLLKNNDIENLLKLIIKKPGIFARKLHHILELSKDNYQVVLNSFSSISDKVELKNLLVMESYFLTIEDSDYKTIINKKGRIRVMDNKRDRVSQDVIQKLLAIIKKAIIDNISTQKESYENKKIWIDKNLRDYTIPLQQRKASDGLLTIGRGSKIPLNTSKVLRLFVYWKETEKRTDLDLSLIQYDEEMNYIGHVSYTNLQNGKIVHSGDIQSAPNGAAEFIDIDLSWLKNNNKTRYLAAQIYRYSGENFGDMVTYSGWMIREKVDKQYKSFNIKTVQNKFNLTINSSYSIPIIIDLLDEKIIYVDLYVDSIDKKNRVEGAYNDISIISKEMIRMIDTKPNMFDLINYNVIGRSGTIVESIEDADITFGVKDCTYNVSEVDKILSEMI